ncbi:hypothetical protein [Terriglobus albidus]|uniref:hypothetical protein n=1 Tax=Terriglobus albidus TaxID=1592106 RepID=UPI0021DF5755|nr:hypothetical protein [Terriglobus albidus]
MEIPIDVKVEVSILPCIFVGAWIYSVAFPSFKKPDRAPRSVAELRMLLLMCEYHLADPKTPFFKRYKFRRLGLAVYPIFAGYLEQMEYEGRGAEVNEEWRKIWAESFVTFANREAGDIASELEPWSVPPPKEEKERIEREKINDLIASTKAFVKVSPPGGSMSAIRKLDKITEMHQQALRRRQLLYNRK